MVGVRDASPVAKNKLILPKSFAKLTTLTSFILTREFMGYEEEKGLGTSILYISSRKYSFKTPLLPTFHNYLLIPFLY